MRELRARRGLSQEGSAPEAVLRFAAGLVRTRRLLAGLVDARASAVRIRLDTDPDGRLRYQVEIPAHARTALRTALAGYHGIQLHEITDQPPAEPSGKVARMELAPARRIEPLRRVGLDRDPLAGFARALGQLHADHGELGTVCVDLLALTPARRRTLRGRMLRGARRAPAGHACRLLSPLRACRRCRTPPLTHCDASTSPSHSSLTTSTSNGS